MRSAFLAFPLIVTVTSLPRFSWDTLPTYFHCSNLSGPFTDDSIKAISRNSFAVFEKMTGLFSPPANTAAENKIVSECARVKTASPTTDCYMCVCNKPPRARGDLRILCAQFSHPACPSHATTGTFCRYTESDWARTWFSLGWEFDAHPEWELHLDAKPGSPLQNTTEEEPDDSGKQQTYYFRA